MPALILALLAVIHFTEQHRDEVANFLLKGAYTLDHIVREEYHIAESDPAFRV